MTKRVLLVVALVLLVAAGTAQALRIQAGDIVVVGNGGFTPTRLPKFEDAPIKIYGGGEISTVSGNYPPVLKTIGFEFDRHGHVETRGLGVCQGNQLEASTVPDARKRCPGSIVGTGVGRGVVKFPEQGPIPVSSPITIFNGPKKHGNDTVFAHFYTTVPAPTAFVIPIEIEKINNGIYGYRTEATIPKIAGGYGIPLSGSIQIHRRWNYKGKRLSYVNARCETGRLQARGKFSFRDGSVLKGTFPRRCQVRG